MSIGYTKCILFTTVKDSDDSLILYSILVF